MIELPRVYAVSESEAVAETLAIVLEPLCNYRAILPAEGEGIGTLPRPALLIDARARTRDNDALNTVRRRWPGVPRLRVKLLAGTNPIVVQRAVAAALRNAYTSARLSDAIHREVAALHADIKFRLVAARGLLAVAQREREMTRDPAWRALSREQFLAIAEELDTQLGPLAP